MEKLAGYALALEDNYLWGYGEYDSLDKLASFGVQRMASLMKERKAAKLSGDMESVKEITQKIAKLKSELKASIGAAPNRKKAISDLKQLERNPVASRYYEKQVDSARRRLNRANASYSKDLSYVGKGTTKYDRRMAEKGSELRRANSKLRGLERNPNNSMIYKKRVDAEKRRIARLSR